MNKERKRKKEMYISIAMPKNKQKKRFFFVFTFFNHLYLERVGERSRNIFYTGQDATQVKNLDATSKS